MNMIETIPLLILAGIVIEICIKIIQCWMLSGIKIYLRGIDSGQEETNEYLAAIRKMLKGSKEIRRKEYADTAN